MSFIRIWMKHAAEIPSKVHNINGKFDAKNTQKPHVSLRLTRNLSYPTKQIDTGVPDAVLILVINFIFNNKVIIPI